jgi:hypothetical protein
MEQRRLAGAGGSHDRHELARLDVERDAPERIALTAADREGLLDTDVTGRSVTADEGARLKNMNESYSVRSAVIGSTPAARRAGRWLAMAPTTTIRAAAAVWVPRPASVYKAGL